MAAAPPELEIAQAVPPPQLLVELPSRSRVFFGNLRDQIFPRRLPALKLNSIPGEFWPDVFVKRSLPWTGFLQSGGYHLLALAVLLALTRLFAMQPRVVTKPAFDHSQVVYYDASEYLPPLNTLTAPAPRPQRADPVPAPQPIISVPPEADNREQTIVTAPKVKLKRNLAMPNIVAWSETQRPQLEIPAAPLTPASDLSRMAPNLDSAVVAPAPETARLSQRRNSLTMQRSVVAPPPDLHASNSQPAAFAGLQPQLIAPPPSIESSGRRQLGDLNIGRSAVIAPAPQLPLAAQRTIPGGRLAGAAGIGPQVVPPPPSAGSGLSSSGGSRGRVVALNLHPVVGAPPQPPVGNRRGTFAASPDGRAGASGSPGSAVASAGAGTGSGVRKASDLPSGLYVGKAVAKPSSVAGDAKAASVNPDLVASAARPRVTTARTMQPESATKLSEPERAVFGNRKFYSLTLNMPNLNSAGGSWVIRFAELHHDSAAGNSGAPAPDLSQPMATRKVDPEYPIQLMRENVAGTVILYAVIHADGSVGGVRILRSVDERLDRFASQAIAQWQFEPATRNGTPVDVEATFQIPFRPSKMGTNF